MTKEELEKATGQELIDERNYCGVDGYYGDYLDDVNAEMLKRFNHLAELEAQIEKMQEKLKADLIAKLEEQIQYSTSPSCTKGMELFIKSIKEWEIKEK